jgi:hypothetical protein
MADKIIKIAYKPRNWAKNFLHKTVKRFIVLVIHRRGGKTTASLNHLNRDCFTHDKHRYAYIAPTYKQAKRIAWRMIKDITKDIPGIKYNESELTVFYPNGTELFLLGADDPDAIRGVGLNGVILDEYAQMSPVVFNEIVTKCVADTLGYIIIIGTPKGKGHFYKIFRMALKSDKWLGIFKTIDDSLKEEEGKTIDNLKVALEEDKDFVKEGVMSEAAFLQEWYLSWEAALEGAVYGSQIAIMRNEKRVTTVPYDESLPVFTVWDLGISKGNSMSIGFYQRPSGRELHLIDYYENVGFGLPHYAKIIKDKPYVYRMHYLPHDARNREKATEKTFEEEARKLFGQDRVYRIPNELSVEEGIEQGRKAFRRLWVDKNKGEQFIDTIGSYVYEFDEKRGVFRAKPVHNFASNCADMWRYTAIVEEEMINEVIKEDELPNPADVVEDEYVGDVDIDEQKGHPVLKGVKVGKM